MMFWQRSSKPEASSAQVRATLVTTPDCHLCEHARTVLERVLADRLTIDEMDWNAADGNALVKRDGVPFAPAVYIEGKLCGYGRLSEGALRNWLREQGLA
jgi:Glutaredoxin-like domain (DUF836)